jgi:pseudouridine-5'-phosphate glycosidase
MQMQILKSFAFAYGGTDVVHYTAGETVDVSTECAELAIAEGWAAPDDGAKAAKPAANKARKAAPENK